MYHNAPVEMIALNYQDVCLDLSSKIYLSTAAREDQGQRKDRPRVLTEELTNTSKISVKPDSP